MGFFTVWQNVKKNWNILEEKFMYYIHTDKLLTEESFQKYLTIDRNQEYRVCVLFYVVHQ